MTKIILDKQTRANLRDLQETLQFVDESGRVLGLFTPTVDADKLAPQISEQEIQRRVMQSGGRTLPEILHDLEKRS